MMKSLFTAWDVIQFITFHSEGEIWGIFSYDGFVGYFKHRTTDIRIICFNKE